MKDADGFIEVVGWDDLQHYRKPRPHWIKLYTRLLNKHEYTDLTFHQRGVLHGLWMEYAASDRQLPDNTLTLTRRLGQRVMTRDLKALVNAGFIEISSIPSLAQRESKRESKKPPIVPLTKEPREQAPRERDEIWDALVLIEGEPVTRSERGRLNAAVKQLRDAGVDASAIPGAAAAYRREWPAMTLSASALVANWSRFANGNGHKLNKPFPCHCGQSFLRAERLAEHQFDVHGEVAHGTH